MELLVGGIVVFLVLKFGGELPNVAKWLRSLVPKARTETPGGGLFSLEQVEIIRDELEITDPDKLRRLFLLTYPDLERHTAEQFLNGDIHENAIDTAVLDGNS